MVYPTDKKCQECEGDMLFTPLFSKWVCPNCNYEEPYVEE